MAGLDPVSFASQKASGEVNALDLGWWLALSDIPAVRGHREGLCARETAFTLPHAHCLSAPVGFSAHRPRTRLESQCHSTAPACSQVPA